DAGFKAFGSHASATTAWSSPAGNGSTHSLSSNMWATTGTGLQTSYYEFDVSTVNWQDIDISWDQTGSATRPPDFALQWSTDGTTFNTFTTYSLASPAVTWSAGTPTSLTSFNFNLASVTALNGAATADFRLVQSGSTSINGSTVGTAGTGRVDNVVITP